MDKKKLIMLLLYIVLLANVLGMLIYFLNGFKNDPPKFFTKNYIIEEGESS